MKPNSNKCPPFLTMYNFTKNEKEKSKDLTNKVMEIVPKKT